MPLGDLALVWFFSLLAIALVLIIAIWFLQRYYAKAALDTALVRTGLGGKRVVIDGGCLALPILHQIQRVSMGSVAFPVHRKGRAVTVCGIRTSRCCDWTHNFSLSIRRTST